jgi:hypothetical protein
MPRRAKTSNSRKAKTPEKKPLTALIEPWANY